MPFSSVTSPTAASPWSCIQVNFAPLQLAVPLDRVEKVVRQSDIVGQNMLGQNMLGQELLDQGLLGQNMPGLGRLGLGEPTVVRDSGTRDSGIQASGTRAPVPSGIVYYAGNPVTLLNLHQYLLQTPIPAGYFLILRSSTGELIAIPIASPPNLIEFPRQSIKVLPSTYRQINLLGIASHVARTAAGHTIFVLDVDYLVTRWCVPQ